MSLAPAAAGHASSVEPQYTVSLPNDVAIPLVGFGTWRMRGREAHDAVVWALEFGYRHLDTATMYANETELGEALRESGVPRDDVFVTTKLPPSQAGQEKETLQRSLDALGTGHVDLWLIHAPPGGAGVDTWREFIDVRERGLARAIGVSNYTPEQIDQLSADTGVTPAVNQVEWSPALFDPALLEHSRSHGVVVEGYSPLKSGDLSAPVLSEIADRYGKTPAQVVIRWHVEHGVVVIPKSAHRDRIASNFDVFDFHLEPEDVKALDGLSRHN